MQIVIKTTRTKEEVEKTFEQFFVQNPHLKKQKENTTLISLGDIPPIAVAIGVGTLVLRTGSVVINNIQIPETGTPSPNITEIPLTSVINNVPAAGTVIGAAIIIGILLSAFRFADRSNSDEEDSEKVKSPDILKYEIEEDENKFAIITLNIYESILKKETSVDTKKLGFILKTGVTD